MNIRVLLLLACLLYSIAGQLKAAVPTPSGNGDCTKQLRSLFARQANLHKLPEKKVYYLKYSVAVTLNDAKQSQMQQADIEVYANKHQSYFKSKEMEVYQDAKVAVSVLPSRKIFFVNNRPEGMEKYNEQRLSQAAFLQDSIFHLSEVEHCGIQTLTDGSQVHKVTLKLTEKGVSRFHIRSVEFILDKEQQMIKSFTVSYDQTHRLRTLQCVFHALNYDYKTDKLAKPALATVWKDKKAWQASYQNYKLIDNRKKKQ
jgi:hypothetical protein